MAVAQHALLARPARGCAVPAVRRATPACAALQRRVRLCRRHCSVLQPARCAGANGHSPDLAQGEGEDGFEGLLQEEDYQVPGASTDSLSSNTQLGRAVQSACDELELLSSLERESQEHAQALLRNLGYKGDLFRAAEESAEREEC